MKTDLKLGVVPITFTGIDEMTGGTYYISGENFTASSKLEINKELVEDTIYISPTLLMVRDVTLEDGDSLTVAQQSNSPTHRVLSRTAAIVYKAPVRETEPSDTQQDSGTEEGVTPAP